MNIFVMKREGWDCSQMGWMSSYLWKQQIHFKQTKYNDVFLSTSDRRHIYGHPVVTFIYA